MLLIVVGEEDTFEGVEKIFNVGPHPVLTDRLCNLEALVVTLLPANQKKIKFGKKISLARIECRRAPPICVHSQDLF